MQQLPLDLKFAPALGREDFIVGACNQVAVHMIESWPEEWAPYPVFTIYGSKGCGKSHLAAVWQHLSHAEILTAENFMKMNAADLISSDKNYIIDGFEFLIGERDEEEKIFHLYNAFQQKEQKNYLLCLSRVSPEKLNFEINDLASRIRAAQSAEIKLPDDALLKKVMAKRLADQSFKISDDVLDYILLRMERSWSGLDKAVNQMSLVATSLKKGELTKPLIRDVLLALQEE